MRKSNFMVDHMRQETGNKDYNNIHLINQAASYCSQAVRDAMPILDPSKPLSHATLPTDVFQVNNNELFTTLINRIGSTIFKGLIFDNPLGVFRDEDFQYGDTVQEIYVGLATAKGYDVTNATSQYQFANTPISAFYHTLERKEYYDRTFDEMTVMEAFVSDSAFNSFIDKQMATLISSDNLDEYTYIRDLVTWAMQDIPIAGGGSIFTPGTQIDSTQQNWRLDLEEELIELSNLFEIPSRTRFQNAALVPNATLADDQYFVCSARLSSKIDTLLANIYHMDKATIKAKKIVVDEFPAFAGTGTASGVDRNGMVPVGALVSNDSFIVKDKRVRMTNNWDAKQMWFNYFLHHWSLISFSTFANTHLFFCDPTDPLVA